jgi:hypothetical protein
VKWRELAESGDRPRRYRFPPAAQPRLRSIDGGGAGQPGHALPDRFDGNPVPDHRAPAAAGRRPALARRQALRVPPAASRRRSDHAPRARREHLGIPRLDPGQRILCHGPVRQRLQAVERAGTALDRLRPRNGLRSRNLFQVRPHELRGPRPGDQRGHRALGPQRDRGTGAEAVRPARDRDLATPGDAGTGPALIQLPARSLRGLDLLESIVDGRRRDGDERHDRRRRRIRPCDRLRGPALPRRQSGAVRAGRVRPREGGAGHPLRPRHPRRQRLAGAEPEPERIHRDRGVPAVTGVLGGDRQHPAAAQRRLRSRLLDGSLQSHRPVPDARSPRARRQGAGALDGVERSRLGRRLRRPGEDRRRPQALAQMPRHRRSHGRPDLRLPRWR